MTQQFDSFEEFYPALSEAFRLVIPFDTQAEYPTKLIPSILRMHGGWTPENSNIWVEGVQDIVADFFEQACSGIIRASEQRDQYDEEERRWEAQRAAVAEAERLAAEEAAAAEAERLAAEQAEADRLAAEEAANNPQP